MRLLFAAEGNEKWLKAKPHVLQALTLDVLLAAWETMQTMRPNAPRRLLPIKIELLLVHVLGLPRYHQRGNWSLRSLDQRGWRILRDKQGRPAIPEFPDDVQDVQAAERALTLSKREAIYAELREKYPLLAKQNGRKKAMEKCCDDAQTAILKAEGVELSPGEIRRQGRFGGNKRPKSE